MIDDRENDFPCDFKNYAIISKYTTGTGYTEMSAINRNIYCNSMEPERDTSGVHPQNFPEVTISPTTYGTICNNRIGAGCTDIRIGDNSINNTIETGCSEVWIKDSCKFNTFEKGCKTCKIGPGSNNNHFGEGVTRVIFGSEAGLKNWYSNITIEPGNNYIYLVKETSSGTYQNVTIAKGVNTTSTYLTISDSNVNQAYKTTFFKETDGTLKKQEGSTITTVE